MNSSDPNINVPSAQEVPQRLPFDLSRRVARAIGEAPHVSEECGALRGEAIVALVCAVDLPRAVSTIDLAGKLAGLAAEGATHASDADADTDALDVAQLLGLQLLAHASPEVASAIRDTVKP